MGRLDTLQRRKLIFRQDMLDSFNANPNHFFKVFLRDNDVYQWVPKSPMRMYYCTLDENVPYENTVGALSNGRRCLTLRVDE